MQLEGRSALITGAGSGIGRALAQEAVARDMDVMLVGRRADRLQETRQALVDPKRGHILVGDVTNTEDRTRLRDQVEEHFGQLDLLINNAGVQTIGQHEYMADAEIQAMLLTNLFAPMALIRDLTPLLRLAAPSRVVNIGSMFGLIGYPLYCTYSASKSGLRGFSDALRRELRDDGIGVTYAAPRATATAVMEQAKDLIEPFEMKIDRPEDIAKRIL